MTSRGRVRGVLALLTATVLVAIPAQGQTAPPGPDEEAKLAASDVGRKAVTDPRQDVLFESESRLSAILAKHPKVAGGVAWTMETQTVTINVVGSAADLGSPAAALAKEIQEAAFPFAIEFNKVPRAGSELQAAADLMMRTMDQWAPGVPGMSYIMISESDGSIIVGVDQAYAVQWRARVGSAGSGFPVTVKPEAHSGVRYESSMTSRPGPAVRLGPKSGLSRA